MMKVACLLLCLVAVVVCVEFDERAFNIHDFVASLGLFNVDSLKTEITKIVNLIGSDATEAQCEKACNKIVTTAVMHSGCPFTCKSFQWLVKHFHL